MCLVVSQGNHSKSTSIQLLFLDKVLWIHLDVNQRHVYSSCRGSEIQKDEILDLEEEHRWWGITVHSPLLPWYKMAKAVHWVSSQFHKHTQDCSLGTWEMSFPFPQSICIWNTYLTLEITLHLFGALLQGCSTITFMFSMTFKSPLNNCEFPIITDKEAFRLPSGDCGHLRSRHCPSLFSISTNSKAEASMFP